MNPDTKLLLKEMRKEFAEQKKDIGKEFADHDTKWEARITAVETKKDDRIEALESAAAAFESWKPTIESSIQTVKTEVQKLSKHWDRAVKDKADPALFPPPCIDTTVWVGAFAPVCWRRSRRP
jgi:predicted  nucleic acid-binding Zn-ribbon protein